MGAAAEGTSKGSRPGPVPIESEHELIEVLLAVGFPQSVTDAQASTFEISKQPMRAGETGKHIAARRRAADASAEAHDHAPAKLSV